MNTHDIDLPDLPPCFEVLTDRTHTEIRAYARAAIEADRKRRGEPVPKGWKLVPETPTSKQIVHMACQIKGADADGWFRTDGDDWHQHVAAAERAYKWALSEAPQPDEPTDKDSLPVAAPVKVQSGDVLDAALSNLEHDNYEQSYSGYKNRQDDIALIRAILARYSHLTATTYKSSNQNRLIEDLKLVYGDNKPIATVITHNNHKLLSFDPGALDELPEGTILYAKK